MVRGASRATVHGVAKSQTSLSDSHMPLFWISFPFRSPQGIEQTSLCYTVDPYYLFYTQQCIYISSLISQFIPLPLFPTLVYIHLFSTSVYNFLKRQNHDVRSQDSKHWAEESSDYEVLRSFQVLLVFFFLFVLVEVKCVHCEKTH